MKKQFFFTLLTSIVFASLFSACEKETIGIDLQANRWKLVKLKDSEDTFFKQAEKDYFLEFTSDTSFTGKLDVNDFFGNYQLPEEGQIELDDDRVGITLVCCESEYAESYLNVFLTVRNYYIRGDELIFEGDGKLVFEAEE